MSIPEALHTAALSLWWHCRECDAARFCCPGCAEPLGVRRPPQHPPALPLHQLVSCPDCGAALAVTVASYRPNPTGEAPASGWPLSDPLPRSQNRHRPALRIPPPPKRQAKPQAKPQATTPQHRPRPAALPAAEPCPPAAERHRLSHWRRLGWLPEGVEPSVIAAAYRRRFRVEPRNDHQFRAYSQRELGLSLGELGLAPPPDPLAAIWQRTLKALALPSTRMLLSQQARLLALEPSTDPMREPGELVARVAVVPDWLRMVQSRGELVANALAETLGCVVAIELQGVER